MNRIDMDGLPCLQESTDPETGKKVWRMPPVNCSLHCEKCGWNPEVREKRIAKMQRELDGKSKRDPGRAQRSGSAGKRTSSGMDELSKRAREACDMELGRTT